MRKYRYPDELEGELVWKEITEQQILNQYLNMHDRMMTIMERPEDATPEACIKFFIETHLAEEIK